MNARTDWVYRVDEPHGSEGWRPYGVHPERWQGTITSDNPAEDAEYAAALVVTDLMTEWERRGSEDVKHVRVLVWQNEAGTEANAVFSVEIQPDIAQD
ncbi:hypothetical protein [Streptomyces sp. NPDC046197]|uniref:hypothetical protein n=1 Tax=Streptomyces sp. NPDC046197 TaxID=3154337 RepID=UPI0033C1826D